MTPKNTICLWFDKDAEGAARFYAATFPDSAVTAIHQAPSDYPGGKHPGGHLKLPQSWPPPTPPLEWRRDGGTLRG